MTVRNRHLRAIALGLSFLGVFGCGEKPATDEPPARPDLGDAELVLYTSLAHESVHVPVDDMGMAEALHSVVFHLVMSRLRQRLDAGHPAA